MMTLPVPPRRTHLLAFWLVLNAGAALAAAILLRMLAIPYAGLVAVGGAAAVGVLGLVKTAGPIFLYRAWSRVGRGVAAVAHAWVLYVAYHVIVASAARAGTRVEFGPPPGSMWKACRSGSRPDDDGGAWLTRVTREAHLEDRAWWYALVPFVALLAGLRADTVGAGDIPANTYTLY